MKSDHIILSMATGFEITFNNVTASLMCKDEIAYNCILETNYAAALAVLQRQLG